MRCGMKYSRVRIMLILISSLIFLSGCVRSNTSTIGKNPNPNPSVASTDYYHRANAIGVENEISYDSVVITTFEDSYSRLADKIRCELKNNNPGKGFYYYYIPFVEYFANDEWIRLSYYPPEAGYDEQWYYCAIENNSELEYSTWITLYPKYLEEKLIPGRYRIVQFVGPTVRYAEFEVI